MEGNMRKRKAEKTREQAEAFTMAMRTLLKQPEKNAQRDSGEKGWTCYYCVKEGQLKRDCPRASKPRPRLHVRSAKDHTGGETAPRGLGFRGQTLKTASTEGAQGSPHKLPS